MKSRIVIISSGQPSLNPRLVKEADSLTEAGYEVTVLYAYWNNWGTANDKQLLSAKKWKAVRLGGSPQQDRLTYFFRRLIHRTSTIIFKKANLAAEYAISGSSYFLIKGAVKYPADLYIGHNLGALPATVKAAKAHQKPCGFDAEDFHRNETSNDDKDPGVILKTYIENKYIPQTYYLTASSPQIADAYHQIFPAIKPVTLLNVFPTQPGIKQPLLNSSGPIKLFWFSQVIGPSRGIEDVVKALQLLKGRDFELHLLGYLMPETKNHIDGLNGANAKMYYHPPIMPDALAEFASQFDIGLALEPGFSRNNDFALSNKIFTYMQAGLSIVSSDTTAQTAFLNQYPSIGKVYRKKGNTQSLADVLSHYDENRDQLLKNREESFQLARTTLNWEVESQKFLAVVKKTLNKN